MNLGYKTTKLTNGYYNVKGCSVYFWVIAILSDDGKSAVVRGAFIDKDFTSGFEVKNYNLNHDQISHWKRVFKYIRNENAA